jgi:hypothetical protein
MVISAATSAREAGRRQLHAIDRAAAKPQLQATAMMQAVAESGGDMLDASAFHMNNDGLNPVLEFRRPALQWRCLPPLFQGREKPFSA